MDDIVWSVECDDTKLFKTKELALKYVKQKVIEYEWEYKPKEFESKSGFYIIADYFFVSPVRLITSEDEF